MDNLILSVNKVSEKLIFGGTAIEIRKKFPQEHNRLKKIIKEFEDFADGLYSITWMGLRFPKGAMIGKRVVHEVRKNKAYDEQGGLIGEYKTIVPYKNKFELQLATIRIHLKLVKK